MKLPLVIRSGVQFKPEETLAIEFAAVYEHWSRSDETRIEDARSAHFEQHRDGSHPRALTRKSPSRGPWSSPKTTETASAIVWVQSGTRTGSPFEAVYYEASAIPDKSLGVSLMDGNKVGYGGATTRPPGSP